MEDKYHLKGKSLKELKLFIGKCALTEPARELAQLEYDKRMRKLPLVIGWATLIIALLTLIVTFFK